MANKVQILEYVLSGPKGSKLAPNRETGVIPGVKILGLQSTNGRTYLAEAVRRALPMYEGKAVNTNHPKTPNESRDANDRFGWLEAVQMRDDGLYGDLHILDPQEPLARKLFNAAERNPSMFGLSHNAVGEEVSRDGKRVVESIDAVVSVDLVADPATTKGLYESKGTNMKKTIKEILEAAATKAWQQAALKALVEMDGDMVAAEMPTDSAVDVDAAFEQMVCGVFRDKSLDTAGKVSKIKEILKAQEKLTAMDEPVPEAEMSDEEKKKADEEAKAKEEAAKQKAGNLKENKSAKILDLLITEGIQPSRLLKKALESCADEAEMKGVIADHKKLTEANSGERVTSSRPGNTGGKQTPTKPPQNLEEAKRDWFTN